MVALWNPEYKRPVHTANRFGDQFVDIRGFLTREDLTYDYYTDDVSDIDADTLKALLGKKYREDWLEIAKSSAQILFSEYF